MAKKSKSTIAKVKIAKAKNTNVKNAKAKVTKSKVMTKPAKKSVSSGSSKMKVAGAKAPTKLKSIQRGAKATAKAAKTTPKQKVSKFASKTQKTGAAKKTASKKVGSPAAKTPNKAPVKAQVIEFKRPKTGAGVARTSLGSVEVAKIFTPLDDRVLVQPEGVSDRTPGGLYIPESVSSQERPNQGRVVAVGRGHRDKKGRIRPLDVMTGDVVMFTPYAGSEVQINGQDLRVLREDDIIAVVKD